ncbi:uncharacterized protein LOC105214920 [Zeugodacus cucurbitae]|uniref:uncharacterized protein LOC105214920 n=1 Tax=Zeugodacus cucurbitae TaxID=28588 RepID=UPI0005968CBE|nr:uncharacterized protein LOC105214920 [Zeugodacus cucurbitae]
MGTLHVCFADVPHYTSATSALAASTLCTTNSTGAPYELNGVNAGDSNSATTMTLHTDLNKDTPPCSLSPGAASSTHSISPTPRYERNMSFFQQLSRRFGLLRSSDDPVFSAAEDDSTDSCSSNIVAMPTVQRSTGAMGTSSPPNGGNAANASNGSNCAGTRLEIGDACMKDGHGSSSEHISCASSETSSTVDIDEQQQQQQRHSPTITTTNSTAAKERRSSARASFSRLHRRSTSSIRRAFESFSLSSRSLSCSGANAATSVDTPHNAHPRSATNNTPIKSALKYNSNAELNRKAQAGTSNSATSLHLSAASASATSSAALKSSKGKTKPPPQRILRQPVSYTYLKGISGLPTQRVPRSAVCCQYARR